MRFPLLPLLPVYFLGFDFSVEDVISQLPSAVAAAMDSPFGMVNPDKLLYLHIAFGHGILSK